MVQLTEKQKKIIIIVCYSLFSIILWQFQLGKIIFYPFTVLGTWFHEMSHGVMALVMGGNFHHLEVNSDGSGVALTSGEYFIGNIANGLVALAGPIGPTIAGAVFIACSKDFKSSKIVLIILSVLLCLSSIIWVRNWFGTPVILAFGILCAFAVYKSNVKFIQNLTLYLGIQACISVYMSIDYLMIRSFEKNGQTMMSDTGNMETYLFFPYWLWAMLIVILSIFSIWKSLKYALK